MLKDKYGQIIYSENDLVELYLTNTNLVFSRPIMSDSTIQFDQELNIDTIPKIVQHVTSDVSVEDFDAANQFNWYMPEEYKNLDIAKYVLDQCENEAEMQRAGQELLLYQERDMFVLLRYLKYLVDTMRANNIVWGVGRGSSVSSFVLFLIGVHKINSLFYQLDIDEFLK
jgi:DNA polymerase III alpha subunit